MNTSIKTVLTVIVLAQLGACGSLPVAPLGREIVLDSEAKTIAKISKMMTDNLKWDHKGSFLRDTHPKDNGCIRGKFTVNKKIDRAYQYGVFQPGASYPVWMRFSNSVDTLTSDEEADFRGLALKLTEVEGARLPFLKKEKDGSYSEIPNDEPNTQDFLFLGHNAFTAANQQEFFEFFDARFNGWVPLCSLAWFFGTHPANTYNFLTGRKKTRNPLTLDWNSVVPSGIGLAEKGKYKTVVRYAMKSCSGTKNNDDAPEKVREELRKNYLRVNLGTQLARGTGCLDFFIQKQITAEGMPVENALVAWDEKVSPFIKIVRITIPSQKFNSQEQKQFCENLSFNPWHGLTVHRPLGSINRARRVVMKDVSDLRLKQNGVTRVRITGRETFPDTDSGPKRDSTKPSTSKKQ